MVLPETGFSQELCLLVLLLLFLLFHEFWTNILNTVFLFLGGMGSYNSPFFPCGSNWMETFKNALHINALRILFEVYMLVEVLFSSSAWKVSILLFPFIFCYQAASPSDTSLSSFLSIHVFFDICNPLACTWPSTCM